MFTDLFHYVLSFYVSIKFVLYGLSLIIFFSIESMTVELFRVIKPEKVQKKNISNNFSESVTHNTFSIQQSGDFHTH